LKLLPSHHECFICGDKNVKGLQFRFWYDGEFVTTKLEGKPEYIGHGSIHGGLAAAVLDEAMALTATLKKRTLCVSAEMIIRYLKPLEVGHVYTVRAKMVADRKILCLSDGDIIDEDSNIFVKASLKSVPLPKEKSLKIHPTMEEYH
jgi:uncharacterized protein (TIGR00369 family)